jgi:PAS domain S-box-containing protein
MNQFGRIARNLLRNPGFWLIGILFVLIGLPHYAEALGHPTFLNTLTNELGLTRHAFERIMFLAPIVWAGFIFSARGAFIASLLALVLMLPRALIVSNYRVDSLFEAGSVFIIGNVLAVTFDSLRHSRERRLELEAAQEELQASERRYRSLFEDAHDAIWIQDMDGTIVACNTANAKLTGYDKSELIGKNVREFLSPEALETAKGIRRKLLEGQTVGETYDQSIRRKDGTEAFIRLSSSLVKAGGETTGFQHIARDITAERRLQENQRHYLGQVTRAQESERKRISRELHDDTIQSLVVLSRQLDALATTRTDDVPPEVRHRLEDLWHQSNTIMQGVRRLSQDLRPAALDRLGLIPAIQMLAADAARFSGIPTVVTVAGTERRLGEEIELVLFRIVQEALRNVWRHSKATAATVTIEFTHYKVEITIADNGIGFDLPATPSELAKEGKLGLAGMEERARLVGATLSAQSRPGQGTTVAIRLAA